MRRLLAHAVLLAAILFAAPSLAADNKVWCERHQTWHAHAHKPKKGQTMSATIAGRHVYYPGSYYGDAIATNKAALLPGETAAFANYISRAEFRDGSWQAAFQGIYVDILDLADPDAISAADFAFLAGNSDNVAEWSAAAAPDSVSVDEGAGAAGSDRIKLTWDTTAIDNSTWLMVKVLANDNTGLAAADYHFWGVAIGECGNNPANAEVTDSGPDNDLDYYTAHPNHNIISRACIECPCDFNRDSYKNVNDWTILRDNRTSEAEGTALLLITPTLPEYYVDASHVFIPGPSLRAAHFPGPCLQAAHIPGDLLRAAHLPGDALRAEFVPGPVHLASIPKDNHDYHAY